MNDRPVIRKDSVYTEYSSPFLNVYDYRYEPGRHYYTATRRLANHLVATMSDEDFKDMTPDAVSCILLIRTPDSAPRLLLTHEFRYPAGRPLLSVPAGLIDPMDMMSDFPVFEAAKREIREETGITVKDTDTMELVNPLLFSSPGITDESNAIVCVTVTLPDTSVINNRSTEKSEHIGGYLLLNREQAAHYISKGSDENDYFYSVYTWIALTYFVGMKSAAGAASASEAKSEAAADKAASGFSLDRHEESGGKWDGESGLLSRAGFSEQLARTIPGAARNDYPLLLFNIILGDLRKIYELYGEGEEHSAISAASDLISDVFKTHSVIGRIAYDEFVVALEVTSEDQNLAERLRSEVLLHFERYNAVSGLDYSLNPLISILEVSPHGLTAEKALDQLAYHHREQLEAKPQSRYQPPKSNEADPEIREFVRKILDTNDFRYHFQPIVGARTGAIIGYEALMRTAPEYHISPLLLLKYASDDGRLHDVERCTMFNVLGLMKKYHERLGTKKIFINSIPGYYLSEEEYADLVGKYGEYLKDAVIEVTEETNIEESTVAFLTKHSESEHFQVAVDDFGTGYSNVTNLLKFLPNYVKIDRFLISEVHLDPKKQHFVNTIVQFAHDNGFQALAEGVETVEELRAVIRMGVDLVQGYYTGMPQAELLDTLPASILADISKANLDAESDSHQKVYLVKDEKELSLIDLSLQKYSTILLSGGEVTLIGNPDFVSGVTIRVKERSECRLTIRNISIGDVDTVPCIDIGQGARLTLNVEGANLLNGNGIRVPDSATLELEGYGELTITPNQIDAYGIGNDYQNTFGRIVSRMNGDLEININGENCVCIGGKGSSGEQGIDLKSGAFRSICAATNCVCIGSYAQTTPISISHMSISIDVRIAKGAMIGSMEGNQDIRISNSMVHIFGSGNVVSAIGSVNNTVGDILLSDCQVDVTLNGWNATCIGAPSGMLEIRTFHVKLVLRADANTAMGMGCRNGDSDIYLTSSGVDLAINSANAVLFGTRKSHFSILNSSSEIYLNGLPAKEDEYFVSNQ
jgi:EAL domain-containing protein (putative c-di-GMP-specific phosphodiesterase class I)/8-oxo-dGTP pyrophosphatase MutT (NUDIX family)/GGDEF domain-containing protein